jgi:hypothetical protein
VAKCRPLHLLAHLHKHVAVLRQRACCRRRPLLLLILLALQPPLLLPAAVITAASRIRRVIPKNDERVRSRHATTA